MPTPDYMELIGLDKAAKKAKDLKAFRRACLKLQARADHFGIPQQEYQIYCDSAWRYHRNPKYRRKTVPTVTRERA